MWLEAIRAFINAYTLQVVIGLLVIHALMFICGSAYYYYKKTYSRFLMAMVNVVNVSLQKIGRGQTPWRIVPDDDISEIVKVLGVDPKSSAAKRIIPNLVRNGVTYVTVDQCTRIQRCLTKMHTLFLDITNPERNCTDPFMLISIAKYIAFATMASLAYGLVHGEAESLKMSEATFRGMVYSDKSAYLQIENLPGEVHQVASILLSSQEHFTSNPEIYSSDGLFLDYDVSFYVLCDIAEKLKQAVSKTSDYQDALASMSYVVMHTKADDITNVVNIIRI